MRETWFDVVRLGLVLACLLALVLRKEPDMTPTFVGSQVPEQCANGYIVTYEIVCK